jgi:cell shape-determining protein MreD
LTRVLKILLCLILVCTLQTTLVRFIAINRISPDLIVCWLVVMSETYGPFGGFCSGAVASMLYDANVGYIMAVNLVVGTAIGYFCTLLVPYFRKVFRKSKIASWLAMMLTAFISCIIKDIVNIGYLFLIGSTLLDLENLPVTLLRLAVSSLYSVMMILPLGLLRRRIFPDQKKNMKKTD